jgi:hypothetical protein
MRPLPEAPTFPVYGLGEHFDGFRWLTLWQRQDCSPEQDSCSMLPPAGRPPPAVATPRTG